jgi:hypothetical protein
MTLNNYKLCTLCDKTISLSNWSHHIKTKKHKNEPEKDFKNLSHKICSKCNLSLSKENFSEDKWNKYGLSSYCKLCRNNYSSELVMYENCRSGSTKRPHFFFIDSCSETPDKQ